VLKPDPSNKRIYFISGILIGILICVGFWAGHEFWPKSREQAGIDSGAPNRLADGKDSTAIVHSNPMTIAENTIANIAKQASDSVVNIDIASSITRDIPFPAQEFDFFFAPGLNELFPPRGKRKFEQHGLGSGIIFRSDGYIITNNHVVGHADDIKVTLNDKRVFKGTVVGRDTLNDIALININVKDLKPARLGTSSNLMPGDWAIAIGSPLGLDHTVTLGIISALGRSLSDLNSNVQLIQTDAAINPGNSGGPLLNIHGEVIGVNTAIRGDGQNIGFAIPIDLVKDTANQLLTKGSIDRPYLGVYMQELDEQLASSLGVSPDLKGVVIAGVAPDSPAEHSGLRQGDIVELVDGKKVILGKDVQNMVRQHKPGEDISFQVLRNGSKKRIDAKIGVYPVQDFNQ
jgi:Do/DeqQ family serine protease